MSIETVPGNSDGALLMAAGIWAEATALRDGLPEPVPPELKVPGLRSALAVPGASLHIAMRERRGLGFVVLVPFESRLEVRYLAVTPFSWGEGIAAKLLDHVTTLAATGAFDAVELWVLTDNQRAIAVYVRAGWVQTTDLKSQIDTRRTEVRLERRFGSR